MAKPRGPVKKVKLLPRQPSAKPRYSCEVCGATLPKTAWQDQQARIAQGRRADCDFCPY